LKFEGRTSRDFEKVVDENITGKKQAKHSS